MDISKIHSELNELYMISSLIDTASALSKNIPSNAVVAGPNAQVIGIPMLINVLNVQNDVIKKLQKTLVGLYKDMESTALWQENG